MVTEFELEFIKTIKEIEAWIEAIERVRNRMGNISSYHILDSIRTELIAVSLKLTEELIEVHSDRF